MASTVLPNGIIIPEKFSRDWYADLYHNWQELDNLLGGGGGGANDGTLTIQKNSSTVGTFSANQATDETVNITVPTATSELTNDSNFVQSSDLATVATSGSYNDLSNTPTIPTVNNATLTIQQNGTTVQTFTANQSTNATANIAVPTKTSDLTNDSGFITSDNTKIPLAGSNQISGDLIPSTDGTVNLGSSSKKFASLNGIAPDELGLPTSTYTDVSSYITNFNSTPNTFTAPVSGLLFLQGSTAVSVMSTLFNVTKAYNVNCPWTYDNVRGFIPVEKGDSIKCYISAPINLSLFRIYHLKGKI